LDWLTDDHPIRAARRLDRSVLGPADGRAAFLRVPAAVHRYALEALMAGARYVVLETGQLVYGPLVWIDGEDVLPPEGPELAAYAGRVGRAVERTWRRHRSGWIARSPRAKRDAAR
jgi:hypothetical protein